MEKDNVIIFENDKGEKEELKIYFTYHSDKFNKDYIVFFKDAECTELVAGTVDNEGNIHDIESDEEYDELDVIIEEYQENNEN